ncbi:MAG: CDP-alcohol phosphatidyltransferase family protein [Candidatus Zixiibacteriota bacterium]|nr:MAG: CDP-alcohol phosphatidyltransferase family protein [candidate division Zixibacteria bacterium]
MKRYLYYSPHILTLAGLAFAALALMAILDGRYQAAARYSLLVLLVDRLDGTMARKLQVKNRLPGISGETLDTITDLVGLTFVPMMLFWRTGLFLDGFGSIIVVAATVTASWKYSRKEDFLKKGCSSGAPPIFFSVFLFYFLDLPRIYPTVYALILAGLCLSPVKYPITSLVTTHWKPGYKSITNYLTALFFMPVFILLKEAPSFIYWLMLIQICVQLFIYPILLGVGLIKPVFDRKY